MVSDKSFASVFIGFISGVSCRFEALTTPKTADLSWYILQTAYQACREQNTELIGELSRLANEVYKQLVLNRGIRRTR